MNRADLVESVKTYYDGKLAGHGATPRGVDWNSHESQLMRFAQFGRLIDDPEGRASVVDYGCGYAAFLDSLRADGHRGGYQGFDVSPAMIAAAVAAHANDADASFTSDRARVVQADYIVSSGIFNVKVTASDEEWLSYVLDTLDDLAALARRGFGFNALSHYSDVERRRADLYYADPLALFDRCKRRYSRFVTLIHDYPLYEFTILVRR